MRGKWKNKGNLDFPFFRSVTPRSQNVFFGRCSLGEGFRRMSRPSFVTKSVRFGRTELLFFFPCSKSRDLGPEHGFRACSFKNKGQKSDFHIFGGQKTNKIREKLNEIGQILVPRALNDTKKIRKAGADIFTNSGAEKTWIDPKTGRMQPRRATSHGAPARASPIKFLKTR